VVAENIPWDWVQQNLRSSEGGSLSGVILREGWKDYWMNHREEPREVQINEKDAVAAI